MPGFVLDFGEDLTQPGDDETEGNADYWTGLWGV